MFYKLVVLSQNDYEPILVENLSNLGNFTNIFNVMKSFSPNDPYLKCLQKIIYCYMYFNSFFHYFT